MASHDLSVVMKDDHQAVDDGLEAFLTGLDGGVVDGDGLQETLDILRRHAYMEEQMIFPPLRQGNLMASVLGMLRGHGEIWRTMDSLTELVTDGAETDRLRETGKLLLDQLARHNKIEEAVIYSVIDTDLESATDTALADFRSAGTLPDGWVCAMAYQQPRGTNG